MGELLSLNVPERGQRDISFDQVEQTDPMNINFTKLYRPILCTDYETMSKSSGSNYSILFILIKVYLQTGGVMLTAK